MKCRLRRRRQSGPAAAGRDQRRQFHRSGPAEPGDRQPVSVGGFAAAGHAGEFNTLLLSDWIAHTPPEVLAKNFGVPAESFVNIPLHSLWIFHGTLPGDLAADRAATGDAAPYPFIFPLATSRPVRETRSGTIRVADSSNFTVAQTLASALVTVKPGGVREMHWHPNADEWQYYIKGRARMTVFNTGPNAITMDFAPGDIGYVPKNSGHYVENVGDTDLQFVGVFRATRYEEVSLTNWLTHTPQALGRAASQCRQGGDCQIAGQRSGHHAAGVSGAATWLMLWRAGDARLEQRRDVDRGRHDVIHTKLAASA